MTALPNANRRLLFADPTQQVQRPRALGEPQINAGDLAREARAQGYNVVGSSAVRFLPQSLSSGPVPVRMPLSTFQPLAMRRAQQNQAGALVNQGLGILQGDTSRLHQANLLRYEETRQEADALGRVAGEGAGQITQVGEQEAGRLGGFDPMLRDAGEQAGRRLETVGNRFADLAIARSEQAMGTMARAEDRFNADAASFSDSFAVGIQSRYNDAIEMLNGNIDPQTGGQMTIGQRMEYERRLTSQMTLDMASAYTGLQMQLQQALASIRTARAQTENEAANVAIRAGEQRLQGQQAAEGARFNFAQLRVGVAQAASAVRQSAALAATQLRMQGQVARANLIEQAPFSPVSLFSGFAAMASMANTPGAQRARPLPYQATA